MFNELELSYANTRVEKNDLDLFFSRRVSVSFISYVFDFFFISLDVAVCVCVFFSLIN